MKLQNVQQLCIFKIEKVHNEEQLLFCGFADTQEEAIEYMNKVQDKIDVELQNDFEGEYIVIPALYFHLKRGSKFKKQ